MPEAGFCRPQRNQAGKDSYAGQLNKSIVYLLDVIIAVVVCCAGAVSYHARGGVCQL